MSQINKRGLVLTTLVLLTPLMFGIHSQPATAAQTQPLSNLAPSGDGRTLVWTTNMARVQAIRMGYATFSLDGVKWQPLRTGIVLNEGATIKTDDKAIVDLFLKQNGPVVRVTPATTLLLKTLRSARTGGQTVIQTDLYVSEGRVLGSVKKLAPGSRYQVTTPRSVCQVGLGASYDIIATGRVTIRDGTGTVVARINSTDGNEHQYQVSAGQTLEPASGAEPATVIATPPGETVKAPPH